MGIEFDPSISFFKDSGQRQNGQKTSDASKLGVFGYGPKAESAQGQSNSNSSQAKSDSSAVVEDQQMVIPKQLPKDLKKILDASGADVERLKKSGIDLKSIDSLSLGSSPDPKKCEEAEKMKDKAVSSKGKTYRQIEQRLWGIMNGGWGVVNDPKTGKPRFPKLSEIYKTLQYYANNGDQRAKALLAEIDDLLKQKHELEEKHPILKMRYTKMIGVWTDKDGKEHKTPIYIPDNGRMDM